MESGKKHSAGQRMGQTRSGAEAEMIRAALRQFERPLVVYAAQLLGGDAERARDIVQEAFFRLCSEPPERVGPHLREWLYTVCRNLAIDVRRKERRMRTMGETPVDTFASSDIDPFHLIEDQDSFSKVQAAMQHLSANQQEVVRLKFQHGMSYKQISEVTNLTVTNIGFLLHTALNALRQRLDGSAERVQSGKKA
jgi:RNA polymerase sigma factor (sigma-70 family)